MHAANPSNPRASVVLVGLTSGSTSTPNTIGTSPSIGGTLDGPWWPMRGSAGRQLHHARVLDAVERKEKLQHVGRYWVVDRNEHHRLAVSGEARELERRDVDARIGQDGAYGTHDAGPVMVAGDEHEPGELRID